MHEVHRLQRRGVARQVGLTHLHLVRTIGRAVGGRGRVAAAPAATATGAQRAMPPRKVFPARNITLLWDHDQMKITNCDEVNQFVKREYREGFGLSGV